MKNLDQFLPFLKWGKLYNRSIFGNDLIAAVIVTIMLIPQSLAYALLAGLPPQVGLYASILPLVGYAVFGTSQALAVGPVAIVSLLTAVAAGQLAVQGSPEYLMVAILLALISGFMLIILGVLRAGFMTNFISHPVISGFITASAIIIIASQLKHILGVSSSGHNLIEIVSSLIPQLQNTNSTTLLIGGLSMGFLFWVRGNLKSLLLKTGLSIACVKIVTKISPIVVVIVSILCVDRLGLVNDGIKIIGEIQPSLPPIAIPTFDMNLWTSLLGSSAIIAIVGYVESISVAQTLAAKRHLRIDPNQELLGLGLANITAAFSGGYPVTGGLSRSAINFNAGAETPAAGIYTAFGVAGATLFLTPLIYFLPIATLAATIIVAVSSLVDLAAIRRAWTYSKSDFAVMFTTIIATLASGVEVGILTGVAISLIIFLFHSARPHFAVVGQVGDTEHFRNEDRHVVKTNAEVLTIRVDESLYFANAQYLEDVIYNLVRDKPATQHLILMCSAINDIDFSALEKLEAINECLDKTKIKFHLSEVKGPVMDKLSRSRFIQDLTGNVFLSQYDALQTLSNMSSDTRQHISICNKNTLK